MSDSPSDPGNSEARPVPLAIRRFIGGSAAVIVVVVVVIGLKLRAGPSATTRRILSGLMPVGRQFSTLQYADDYYVVGESQVGSCVLPWSEVARSPKLRLVRDAWGNPVYFASPGPIHTRGWDVWSSGPNQENDGGHGDDIVFGEDFAIVNSK